jgi:GAF domain-containing protein
VSALSFPFCASYLARISALRTASVPRDWAAFGSDSLSLQLSGHHASLPLALLILYQDFRFALADIFLKRALALLLLAGLTFGVFDFAVNPLLVSNAPKPESTVLLLGLWVATAMIYPLLRRGADWFVDKIVLKRADYAELTAALSRKVDRCETSAAALDQAVVILAPPLTAESLSWVEEAIAGPETSVEQDRRNAAVKIPTSEHPYYVINIRHLAGGRRLLSDDIAMLEHTALIIARRIDAIRSIEERYRHDVQEQEMRKLAAEAELRALRAQINPHFLFNALTTIGYLIKPLRIARWEH